MIGGLIFAAFATLVIGFGIYLFKQEKRIEATAKENREIRAHADAIEEESRRLRPYGAIPDAEAEAKRIIAEAQEYQRAVVKWGEDYTHEAQIEESLARRRKDEFEARATAMKNVVDGYGSEYLVPAQGLLDALADDFGYTEAGQKLKEARTTTKALVKGGRAVTSGYADVERKEIACSFVLDAFNGKVDSILASVKAENFGILKQKIQDAFTLVNQYGDTFGDTRITLQYLKNRVEELKWAATAQQLRLDEKEEQRRIREQMREEEKVRKEFERKMAENQKREDQLQREMEIARQAAAQAGEEQKAEYERRIAEMEAQLEEAREASRRTISLAEQTKRGHVYIISNVGSFGEHVFKIGLTRRQDPQERIDELGDASVPFAFDVHAKILSDNAPALEAQLHRHFALKQMNKANQRKEFFRIELAELKAAVEKLGVETQWTLYSEASEWRRTLEIEQSIKEDPAFRANWLRKQGKEIEPPSLLQEERPEEESEAVLA